MEPILLATVSTYALFGAAFALILLLVFQVRLARKHEALADDMHRLQKEQKQGLVDARARLDDVTRAVDRLAEEVQPKIEALPSEVTRVDTQVQDLHRRLEAYHPKTEAAERNVKHLQERTEAARAQASAAEKLAQEQGGRFGDVESALSQVRTQVTDLDEELARTRVAITNQVGMTQAEIKALGVRVEALTREAASAAPVERDDDVPARVVSAESRPAEGRAIEAPEPVSAIATGIDQESAGSKDRIVAQEEPAMAAKTVPAPVVEPDTTVEASDRGAAVADFTFEASDDEDEAPGTKGLLVLVIVLALLTLGFSLFGVGR